MGYLNKAQGISTAPENKLHLLHGFTGSGKTTIAGTYPKPMLVIEIDTDGGSQVLKKYSDTEVKRISIGRNDRPFYKTMLDILNEIETDTHYKTVLIDPYSAIQDILVEHKEAAKGSKLNKQEWGEIGIQMTVLRNKVAKLSQGDRYMVLSLHTKSVEDNDTYVGDSFDSNYPKLTKNNANNLMEMCEAVIYCTKKVFKNEDGSTEVGYVGYIGQFPTVRTKFRVYKTTINSGFYVRDLTFDKIKAIAEGEDYAQYKATNVVEVEKKEENEKEVSEDDTK